MHPALAPITGVANASSGGGVQAEQQAAALRKAKEAPEGEANDFDKAAEFGRLRTVKVQQAGAQDETEREVAREMAVRMRQAQRNMKGVKLQYTEAGRITFDDVAGIGDAKARRLLRFSRSKALCAHCRHWLHSTWGSVQWSGRVG